jgi:hypothetical protein
VKEEEEEGGGGGGRRRMRRMRRRRRMAAVTPATRLELGDTKRWKKAERTTTADNTIIPES